ncbi:MAG TPA: NAD(P)/FAD-dependent oxidoreductase [Microbacterium sp.]|uniref:FAD-dependent oxidoreductase n=1 Tax=Microbacterium sp. TaxID=51671 RepID=UPI002BA44CC0|nr:NAD(P)/FAD-dependent oxidoreductase [Microbacterium sp.]HWI30954.1 NAD(P)/FAD-dependent oxidoreductase [Microbacterium sp.]
MAEPIAIIGAGPAGMATALALQKVGHPAVIYERYKEARPAGNILNLWPPPIKALQDMGVDTDDLGAPCAGVFTNAKGHVRADVHIDPEVQRKYNGGFIGMLRPVLYERMLAALPEDTIQPSTTITDFHDHGDGVTLTFADGTTKETPVLIGADGIDSMVRRKLWGDSPKREHKLHIIGGYTMTTPPGPRKGYCVVAHGRKVQGSYSSIRKDGQDGFQWWVLEAWNPETPPPASLAAHARSLAAEFPAVATLVAATPEQNIQRWQIRDRVPLEKWSKGRATLAGDSAHATSPYAAYGAGMSIGDGYFIAKNLNGVDLADTAAVVGALETYEQPRIPHTTAQVQMAYQLGQMFHHAPAIVRPVRDFYFDHSKMLQKQIGDQNPKDIIAQLGEMGEALGPSRDALEETA